MKYDYVKLKNKIDKCKNYKFDSLDNFNITNFETIKISKKKSSSERILDFLNKVENPYLFKVKNRVVLISFSDSGIKADDCLINVIKKMQ